LIDQEELHKQCFSYSSKKRTKALKELKDHFSLLPDKEKAWNDLIKLTSENHFVRYLVISALDFVSFLPGKQVILNKLIILINDKHWDIIRIAASALEYAFFQVPNKQKAWNDLIKLTTDKDGYVMRNVANALGSALSEVPDKQQALNDLHKLTNDKDSYVRWEAALALSSAFSHVPDKQKAWKDLIKLTNDPKRWVRSEATSDLGSKFSDLPDKQNAWNDLIKLTTNQDYDVRHKAANAFSSAFFDVPDKQQALNDLHILTNNKDTYVKVDAVLAICSAFSQVQDKQQMWKEFIKLANDEENSYVRIDATYALGSAFTHMPDKQKAWNDLIRLTTDEGRSVWFNTAYALGSAFYEVPDKQKAWNDLHKLTNDISSSVRSGTAYALGSAFPEVLDKQKAWNDLHKLTSDQDSLVRTYANHSLGKVSIFRASQSEKEEEYKKELETAIMFFEKAAAQESSYIWSNPARFCLPFYRSFYTIIFKRQKAKEEVDKYLAEAKDAVRGSKSKELLFEAVETLANALKEVQDLGNLDLEAKKGELNFYRQYCDRAAELMRETEETAPFATIAMRKGLPILDRNLKELLEEIQKKAKIACKESKGTDTEEIACTINREIQTWEIGSQEEMAFNVENLIFTLESNVPRIPENQYIFNRIQQIREQKDVPKQFGIVSTIIPLIPKIYMEQTVSELKNDIKEIKEKVDYVVISVKPGIKEEIEISVGTEVLGTGLTHKITIPLQEISYSELKEDLEKITGIKIDKLSKMPRRLANKIKGYLLLHDKEDVLEKLI
jgi:HEAT repeat protein